MPKVASLAQKIGKEKAEVVVWNIHVWCGGVPFTIDELQRLSTMAHIFNQKEYPNPLNKPESNIDFFRKKL